MTDNLEQRIETLEMEIASLKKQARINRIVMIINDRINPIPCFSLKGPVGYDGHGKFPCPLCRGKIEQEEPVYFFRMIKGTDYQKGSREFGLMAMHSKCVDEMCIDTQYMD